MVQVRVASSLSLIGKSIIILEPQESQLQFTFNLVILTWDLVTIIKIGISIFSITIQKEMVNPISKDLEILYKHS
jgi:hypothetical protein